MQKIIPVLTFALVLLTPYCTKKQFIAFERAHEVMQVKAKGQMEILQEPMKKEMVAWDAAIIPKLPVEGILRVTYKGADYFYLQLNCPQELKCNGKKVYIPRNLTHAFSPSSTPFSGEFKEPADIAESARFIVAPATSIGYLSHLQNWLVADVKREIPALFDPIIFYANLPENWPVYYANLNFFAECILSRKYPEFVPAQFGRQFPVFTELARAKGAPALTPDQIEFVQKLRDAVKDEAQEILRQEVDGFPFMHPNYKAMATAFNGLKEPVLLRANLASRILGSTEYTLAGTANPAVAPGGAVLPATEVAGAQPPAVKITAVPSIQEGLSLEYEVAGEKKALKVPEELITARPHAKGIAFIVGKDTPEQLVFEPIGESDFLKSGNSAEIQKFVKGIPDYKKFLPEYDFDQALLRIAMKYGKGQLNRQTTLFEYEIDLAQNRNFWIVLAAIKQRFGEDSEEKFSGPVPDKYGPMGDGSDRKGSIDWYQKYDKATKEASMGIKGKATYCQRMCEDLEVDMVCLENKGTLRVTFRPAALYAKPTDPDYWQYSKSVHADFPESQGETSCNSYFKLRRTSEKFL